MTKYKIVRYYFHKPGRHRIIRRGLTLEQSQLHCNNPETSSSTATTSSAKRITLRNGPWFDGYKSE